MHTKRLMAVISVAVMAATMAACGSSSSSSPSTSAAPKASGASGSSSSTAATGLACPKHSFPVAFAGATKTAWATATVAAMQDEVASCKAIGVVKQTYATSLSQAVAQIDALVADGTKAIAVEPENGPGELAAMHQAVVAGATVVPILNNPGGALSTDYQSYAFQNTVAGGAAWAKFFSQSVKSGTIAFLGGPAGATSSEAWFAGLQAALKHYPSLHLVVPQMVATNWDAGDVTSAVAGLLAKYGRIDGIAMDYGVTSTGVVKAYQDAHMALPAIATVASGEVNACQWHTSKFPFFTLGGSTYLGALALKMAVAIGAGHKVSPASVSLPAVVDTASGLNPPACDPSVGSTVPLTQVLPSAQRTKAEQSVLSNVA